MSPLSKWFSEVYQAAVAQTRSRPPWRRSAEANEALKFMDAEKDNKYEHCPFCGEEITYRGYTLGCMDHPNCAMQPKVSGNNEDDCRKRWRRLTAPWWGK